MKIKSLVITTILLTSTIWSQAQQINAVPDYVFRNQMSVGRNAVTDTAAYFSIGPRYGATKGFMPPIVGDTATFSSGKRNGLLIFSVQKNKFLYWDSVRVQWSDMAGSSGAYIVAGDTAAMLAPYLRKVDTTSMLTAYLRKSDTTAMLSPYYRSATASAALALKLNISDTSSMLANYIRHAGYGLTKSGQSLLVDTLNIATRAWRQKGLDSLAALEVSGSGTTNYVAKFTAGSTIGNSQIFDNGTNVGIGTASPVMKFETRDGDIGVSTLNTFSHFLANRNTIPSGAGTSLTGIKFRAYSTGTTYVDGAQILAFSDGAWSSTSAPTYLSFQTTATSSTSPTERLRIFANGRVFVGSSPTDAGYQLDVNGTLRSVNGAYFATTSGNVGVGITADNPLGSGGTYRNLMVGNGAGYGAFQGVSTATAAGSTLAAFMGGTTGASSGFKTAGYMAVELDGTSTTNATGRITFTVGQSTGAYLEAMRITSSGEVLINTQSDAGDYKLQVVGNARVGTGKLDIASNTTFGLGVARSGTSEVAGQIYNSNGILYLGAESSAGGQIFSGSSAYAAVIGSGANYPLQFATNNITRATMTTSGNLLLGFTTDSYFLKLQVNGSIFSNNQVLAQGVNAQIAADSSANISPLYISNQSLTGSSAQGLLYGSTTWNTTGNPSLIDLAITNTASGSDANYIKISDGSNIFRVTKAAEVVTAAPTGGSIRKWKLGEAATVSPTSPNRTIRVEIDGTVYYLHAKTTND